MANVEPLPLDELAKLVEGHCMQVDVGDVLEMTWSQRNPGEPVSPTKHVWRGTVKGVPEARPAPLTINWGRGFGHQKGGPGLWPTRKMVNGQTAVYNINVAKPLPNAKRAYTRRAQPPQQTQVVNVDDASDSSYGEEEGQGLHCERPEFQRTQHQGDTTARNQRAQAQEDTAAHNQRAEDRIQRRARQVEEREEHEDSSDSESSEDAMPGRKRGRRHHTHKRKHKSKSSRHHRDSSSSSSSSSESETSSSSSQSASSRSSSRKHRRIEGKKLRRTRDKEYFDCIAGGKDSGFLVPSNIADDNRWCYPHLFLKASSPFEAWERCVDRRRSARGEQISEAGAIILDCSIAQVKVWFSLMRYKAARKLPEAHTLAAIAVQAMMLQFAVPRSCVPEVAKMQRKQVAKGYFSHEDVAQALEGFAAPPKKIATPATPAPAPRSWSSFRRPRNTPVAQPQPQYLQPQQYTQTQPTYISAPAAPQWAPKNGRGAPPPYRPQPRRRGG